MFHCYYCDRVLIFTPKFKLRPRNAAGFHGPLSDQGVFCPICKAIYSIKIEITSPTTVSNEVLEEHRNKPVK